MKDERITYWRCPDCCGTGKLVAGNSVTDCYKCDGTGNGMVDGEKAAHQRRIDEIEKRPKLNARRKPPDMHRWKTIAGPAW